jgi:aspartate-semialdehyde dehydrogenase
MPGRPLTLAIVGATGAVGRTLLEVLDEGGLPVERLTLLASERSAGSELDFRGEALPVSAVTEAAFEGVALAFFAATAEVSRAWAGRAWARGCVVVDLSPAHRDDPAVPLVVPELHGELQTIPARGVVATPGASATHLALALAPLHAAAGIERVSVVTCEAVSGGGRRASEELEAELRAMLSFQEPPTPSVLPHRLAFNLVPQAGAVGPEGISAGERDVARELRRLLGADPGSAPPSVSATVWVAPLFHGHSHAVSLRLRRTLAPDEARGLLSKAPGVKVLDAPMEGVYPMPMLAVNDDSVLVGRIRGDPGHDRVLHLLVTGDNLRRGAAATAVSVARSLTGRGLLPLHPHR